MNPLVVGGVLGVVVVVAALSAHRNINAAIAAPTLDEWERRFHAAMFALIVWAAGALAGIVLLIRAMS